MPLTNAERQKRFRERRRSDPPGVAALSAEERAARDAVMSEPIWPTPTGAARDQMPTFMEWNRYDWSAAPMALINFFGMRAAREGWDAESVAMQAAMDKASKAREGEAERIIAECGPIAREIMREGGRMRLFREYQADPTLGQKRRKALR